MKNRKVYAPEEIKIFVDSFLKLDNALKDFYSLNNLYSAYGFTTNIGKENMIKLSSFPYASNCINDVEKMLQEYEINSSKNLRELFINNEEIKKIKVNIKEARKCLEKIISVD